MDNDTSQQQFEHHQEEEWHEHTRRLINEIHEITETKIKNSANCRNRAAGSCNPIASRIDAYKPF